jgi:hypothetical protein
LGAWKAAFGGGLAADVEGWILLEVFNWVDVRMIVHLNSFFVCSILCGWSWRGTVLIIFHDVHLSSCLLVAFLQGPEDSIEILHVSLRVCACQRRMTRVALLKALSRYYKETKQQQYNG